MKEIKCYQEYSFLMKELCNKCADAAEKNDWKEVTKIQKEMDKYRNKYTTYNKMWMNYLFDL